MKGKGTRVGRNDEQSTLQRKQMINQRGIYKRAGNCEVDMRSMEGIAEPPRSKIRQIQDLRYLQNASFIQYMVLYRR